MIKIAVNSPGNAGSEISALTGARFCDYKLYVAHEAKPYKQLYMRKCINRITSSMLDVFQYVLSLMISGSFGARNKGHCKNGKASQSLPAPVSSACSPPSAAHRPSITPGPAPPPPTTLWAFESQACQPAIKITASFWSTLSRVHTLNIKYSC